MSWYHPSTILDKVFEGGILIKGIDGGLEFLGGLLLFFVDPVKLQHFLTSITQREFTDDPHSTWATLLLHSAQHISLGNKYFAIAYLWIHGGVKLVAVFGLLRNQMWAYPFSLITLGLLMIYQVYSIIVHVHIGMVLLTLFDIFVLWLIWREWSKVKTTVVP